METIVMNREPAVAGSFYPSDPKLLHIILNQYINDCESVVKYLKHLLSHMLVTFIPVL